MRKQHKSPKIKNKKITKKNFDGGSLRRLCSLLSYFLDLAPEMKNSIVGISSD